MKLRSIAVFAIFAAALAACSGLDQPTTSGEPLVARYVPANVGVAAADWTVSRVQIDVSPDLTVSDADLYYPIADIVWRGDPPGDRRLQVATLMEESLTDGLSHLSGTQDVSMTFVVRRFHSVTERARAALGGVHSIMFDLSVFDTETGLRILGPLPIDASLAAFGRGEALKADLRGETQKVRIRRHLGNLMRVEFPGNGIFDPVGETEDPAGETVELEEG
ncbi:MAG: hypothetical protein JXR14_03125 [Paracoccaceae bacterium]